MEKKDNKAYAHAEKAYMQGNLFPFIQVGMQKVNLTPTVTMTDGEKVMTPNKPVYIYDTSGPFSDPNIEIDLKKGLPRMRESWITSRGDVEQLTSITSEYGKCAEMTSRLTIYGSSTSRSLTAPKKENAVHRCIMPSRVSLLRKWNMWPSVRT